ncbi:MAG: hypothetical protein AB8F74_09535 [Saprospiraceae bacterium]
MKTIQVIFFFFIVLSLNAQDRYVYVQGDYKHMQWGESHYSNDLDGLIAMMKDVELEDPFLYEKLAPELDVLQKRKTTANIILGIGGVASVGVMTAGVLASMPDDKPGPPSPGSNNSEEQFREGATYIIAGGLLGVITSVIYYQKMVKQKDIFTFTNRFNRLSDGDKIKFSLRPEIGFDRGGGVGVLVMNFRFQNLNNIRI